MYRNALDPYGLSYEPNVGWDSPEATSTANVLFAAQPSRFPRWELNALAGGDRAKAGLFGKALGALGLDESGNRAATSWTDAAKHTASNVINAPQDIANQLLSLKEYQPVYGTSGDAENRSLAGRQAGEVFGLAGLAPIAGAGLTRAMRPTIANESVTAAEVQALGERLQAARNQTALNDNTHAALQARIVREKDAIATQKAIIEKLQRRENELLGEYAYLGATNPENFSGITAEGNAGSAARYLMPKPGQDPVPGVTRMDGSAFYSNAKEAALPGMVVQGYRGHNPELGIGPRPDRVQAVWASPDEALAQRFTKRPEGDGVVSNVEMRFDNPYVVDAKGSNFDNVPVRDQSSLLRRLLAPTMRYHVDDLAREKAASGHDGMIVKNLRETGEANSQRTADQYVALKRGTVFDPATGNLLWSNPKEASLPALMSQSREGQGEIVDIIRKYGWAAAAPLIAAYQTDGAQANALAGR